MLVEDYLLARWARAVVAGSGRFVAEVVDATIVAHVNAVNLGLPQFVDMSADLLLLLLLLLLHSYHYHQGLDGC